MGELKHIDLDNPEFQQALNLVENTRSSVFLTGKAGTGKSTFMRYIVQNTRKKCVVLAPTGIAAINAGGQTLHSFFQIPLKPLLADDKEFDRKNLRNRMRFTKDKLKLFRELELIIIDEISMVRADVLDFIDRILRYFCNNPRQPFAGKQILMVGDIYQLEPVTTSNDRDLLRHSYPGTTFFFDANVFKDCIMVPIELRKVYRQSDQAFISVLDRIRADQATAADIAAINARVVPGFDPAVTPLDKFPGGKMTMVIATLRATVDNINTTRLAQLTTKPRTYAAAIRGEFPKTSFPTEQELTLKKGAQVVFIRNDSERRWVNGTIGTIAAMEDDRVEVTLDSGETVEVEAEVWENMRYSYDEKERTIAEEVLGTFTQLPIKLAWAMTIHKSQGSTFANVVIDLGRGAFTGGQTYVALSRCTSLDGIILTRALQLSDVFVNPAVKQFAQRFNDQALVQRAYEEERADQLYGQASADFAAGRFLQAVDHFASAIAIRNDLQQPSVRRMLSRKLTTLAAARIEVAKLTAQVEGMRRQLQVLSDEYYRLGMQCLDDGYDTAPAIANFEKALQLNPDNEAAAEALSKL